jgi:hypothetical protein
MLFHCSFTWGLLLPLFILYVGEYYEEEDVPITANKPTRSNCQLLFEAGNHEVLAAAFGSHGASSWRRTQGEETNWINEVDVKVIGKIAQIAESYSCIPSGAGRC